MTGSMSSVTRTSLQARRALDERFERIRTLLGESRPHRGWVRAIRDALGMSGAELAARMGVSQSTVVDIERSEADEKVKLATLRRAAEALDCELVYFLVPRTTLEDTVRERARAKAARHLERVAHHSRIEDQELTSDARRAQQDRFAEGLIDRRGLWADDDS